MAGPPYLKLLLHLPPPFSSMKSSSSSSSIIITTSSKLKQIIHSFILSQLYRIARALAKAKSLIIEVVKNFHVTHIMQVTIKKNTRNKNKLYVGSFRLHYNWCSSRIMPEQVQIQMQMPVTEANSCDDNDVEEVKQGDQDSQLSGYLHWLEHKTGHDEDSTLDPVSEIDQLADLFIENCHEKFRLEKIDSYRRFQEMMARSI